MIVDVSFSPSALACTVKYLKYVSQSSFNKEPCKELWDQELSILYELFEHVKYAPQTHVSYCLGEVIHLNYPEECQSFMFKTIGKVF